MHGINVSFTDFHCKFHKNHIDSCLFCPKGRIHDNQIDLFWDTVDCTDVSIYEIKWSALEFFIENFLGVMNILLIKLESDCMSEIITKITQLQWTTTHKSAFLCLYLYLPRCFLQYFNCDKYGTWVQQRCWEASCVALSWTSLFLQTRNRPYPAKTVRCASVSEISCDLNLAFWD